VSVEPTDAYSGLKEVAYLSGVGIIVFNLIFDHGEWATATRGIAIQSRRRRSITVLAGNKSMIG
jgi:hypothetical protein